MLYVVKIEEVPGEWKETCNEKFLELYYYYDPVEENKQSRAMSVTAMRSAYTIFGRKY
jgi:hypothetical protein